MFVWGSQVVYLAHYIISNSISSAGLPVLTTKQSKRYHSESSNGCSFPWGSNNFSASENSLLRPQEADNDLCREPAEFSWAIHTALPQHLFQQTAILRSIATSSQKYRYTETFSSGFPTKYPVCVTCSVPHLPSCGHLNFSWRVEITKLFIIIHISIVSLLGILSTDMLSL